MAAIPRSPQLPQPSGGIYMGFPDGHMTEKACAIFVPSQLKEGGSFYFSPPVESGEPRQDEVVTMTNFTSKVYDQLGNDERYRGHEYDFEFAFGGTQYTGVLRDGTPYPLPYSQFSFYPAKQQERAVTLPNRSSGGPGETWSAVRVWNGHGKMTSDRDQNFSGTYSVVVVAPRGIGAGMPLVIYGTALYVETEWQENQTHDLQTPGRFSMAKLKVVYDLDEGTKQLSVAMPKLNGDWNVEKITATQHVAQLDTHHHDLTPPKPAVESRTVDCMRPQVSPALTRILEPMPFPSTLVETLAHTASFVDQAGYLAKYAVDRYAELDKAYHAFKEESTTSSKENKELKDKAASNESELKRLTDENKADKDKLDALAKSLADARDAAAAREAELTKTVQELQKTVSQGQEHDAADHKALDDAQKVFKEEETQKNQLKKALDESEAKVVAAKSDNDALNKRLQEITKKYSDVAAEVSDLNGKLEAENAENTQLKADNKTMKDRISALEKQLADATKALARAQEDLKQAQSDFSDNDSIIEDLERGFEGAKKDRDAKKRALEELKKRTDETIKDLQDQITAAQAHDLEDHKTIVGLSDKLNQANAH